MNDNTNINYWVEMFLDEVKDYKKYCENLDEFVSGFIEGIDIIYYDDAFEVLKNMIQI